METEKLNQKNKMSRQSKNKIDSHFRLKEVDSRELNSFIRRTSSIRDIVEANKNVLNQYSIKKIPSSSITPKI